MALHAFKNGVTPFSEATMNPQLSLQDFMVWYDGQFAGGKEGSGVVENSLANYTYMARFMNTSPGFARIELELDRDGQGSDITVELRAINFNPNGSNDGTLLYSILIPAHFIPETRAYVSIPLPELEFMEYYWLRVNRAGSSTNKIDWVGETSQDANYPCYRRAGTSGAWTATNALHFRLFNSVFTGNVRNYKYGTNELGLIDYASGLPSRFCTYLPPSDGPAGGIRKTLTITWINGMPVIGEVS